MNNAKTLSASGKVTYFAVLTALTVILQLVGNTVRIGIITLNFSLVPIVICGLLLGVYYAISLGAVTGLIILLNGVIGGDGFTNVLFGYSPVVIILVCIVKTAAAGGICALIYGALRKKNELLGVLVSSAAVPIVNSGLFAVGMFTIIPSLISAGFMAEGDSALYVVFIAFIGLNFVFELAVNLIVAPAVYRVIRVINGSFPVKSESESSSENGNKTEGEE